MKNGSFFMRWLFFAFGFSALMVSSCQTAPPIQKFPELTWTHLKPYVFNLGKVKMVSRFTAPLQEPHVEHLLPFPIQTTAMNWGRDRIETGGEMGGTVTFIVEEASVVEVSLRKQKEGMEGYFTDEQSERYDMKVKVKIQVLSGDGLSSGSVSAHAVRTQTVAEDITLDERERVWFAMTEALMKELNATLETNIPKHLGKFLLRNPN
jgi:hypothetical protein